jgi:hypothetical protein
MVNLFQLSKEMDVGPGPNIFRIFLLVQQKKTGAPEKTTTRAT